MKMSVKVRGCSRRAKWVLFPTLAVALASFLAFVWASEYLGGDALNGHITAGRYFLCMHGHCTEVSSSIWRYSYWHALITIAAFFGVLAETALFLNTGDLEFE